VHIEESTAGYAVSGFEKGCLAGDAHHKPLFDSSGV